MNSFRDKARNEEYQKPNSSVVDYGSLADPSCHPRARTVWRSTIIEPIILVYSVAQVLSETVMTNLLEYRTCKTQLSLSDSNCTEPIPRVIEDLIQPITSHIILGRSLMEALVPACLALFIGPWSDANGRKPFLVAAMAGSAVTYLCCAGLVLMPNVSANVFPAASLPLALTGGPCTVNMLVVCYITDVTDDQKRPFRLSLYTMALLTSVLFAMVSTSIVSAHLPLNPYSLVFTLSAFLMILCCLYTHWFIQETVPICPIRERRLFRLSHVKGFFESCCHSQNGHAKTMILLIIVTFMLNVFLAKGEVTVTYLSTREMFSWQLSDFTRFSIFGSLVYGLGVLSGVWLFNSVLGLSNIPLAALLLATRCARCIIMACSTAGIDFYVATLVGTFYASYTPLCCAELCRLVSKEDLGKVFALSTFLDNITPIISSPVYTFVYEATYLHMPGSVYWLGAALCALSVSLLVTVYVLQRLAKGSCYTSSYLQDSGIKN